MSNPIGTSWAEPSFADTSWVAGSWGVFAPAPIIQQQQPSGGTRYVDIDLRRARARAAKRKLDEERRRLSELKRQQSKIEVQYKSIPLVEKQPVTARSSDRAHLLELEIKEYEQRVSLQAARVKEARKASDFAKREAEAKQSADEAIEAHRELEAQSEWQRIENERLQQEADDEEMQTVLLLIHEEL